MAIAIKDNINNQNLNDSKVKSPDLVSSESIKKQDPINLLPSEFKPNSSVIILSKKLNNVALISLVIFLTLGIASLASVFLLRYRANSAQQTVEELSAQVSVMEQSEQRLILIKDRLTKISSIKSTANLHDTVLTFKYLYDNLPPGLQIVSTAIESKQIETNIEFDNSSDLARFLAQTVSDKRYNLIKIDSLELGQQGKLSMDLVIGT